MNEDKQTNNDVNLEKEYETDSRQTALDGTLREHELISTNLVADYNVKERPEVTYAGFWMRFWAYLADLLVIGSLNRILISPLSMAITGNVFDGSFFSFQAIGTTIVFYLYFVLMTRFFGKTLGKMIFGLRVVSLKEEKISWGTLVFREFIGRFIAKFLFAGYIIVGFLPKKQGLHDIFADTTVILDRR
ncbi:RDD family protein [Peribacillus huizhouensis]|uniref:RDD family membrane protein YckC n=1 Tax=Peribacillus huizhouensis TaxID=1501239 RepID=A0ABR6CPN2_9BACI|nr:RDD family protein [Peribacillus huizhouensis]MBA9026307.1 putative RDD family membrane protein YckC [Peribacillus huizhouensis]